MILRVISDMRKFFYIILVLNSQIVHSYVLPDNYYKEANNGDVTVNSLDLGPGSSYDVGSGISFVPPESIYNNSDNPGMTRPNMGPSTKFPMFNPENNYAIESTSGPVDPNGGPNFMKHIKLNPIPNIDSGTSVDMTNTGPHALNKLLENSPLVNESDNSIIDATKLSQNIDLNATFSLQPEMTSGFNLGYNEINIMNQMTQNVEGKENLVNAKLLNSQNKLNDALINDMINNSNENLINNETSNFIEISSNTGVSIGNNTPMRVTKFEKLQEEGSNEIKNILEISQNLGMETNFILDSGIDSSVSLINNEINNISEITNNGAMIEENNMQNGIVKFEELQEESNAMEPILEAAQNLNIQTTSSNINSNVNLVNIEMSNFNKMEDNAVTIIQNDTQENQTTLNQQQEVGLNTINNTSEAIQNLDTLTEPAFIFKTGIDSGPIKLDDTENIMNETINNGAISVPNNSQEGMDKLEDLQESGSYIMTNKLEENQNLGVKPISTVENIINPNINSSNIGINSINEIENNESIIIQNNTEEIISEIKPLPEAGSNALENTQNLNTENVFIFKTGVDSGPIIVNSETASDEVIVQNSTQEEIPKLETIQEEGLNAMDNTHKTSPNLDITSDFITNTENDYDSNVNVDNDGMSNLNEIENNGTGVTQNSNQGDIIKLKQQPEIKSNVISNASETIQDFDTEPAFIFKTGIDSGPIVINGEVNNINETVLDGTAVIQNGIQEGVDTLEDLQESGSNTLTNTLEETQNLGIKADFIEGNGTDSNTTLVNVGNSFNEIKNDGAIGVQNNIQEQISNLEQLQEAGSNTLQDLQDSGTENVFIFKTGIDSGPIIVNNEVNNLYDAANDGTIIVQNDVQEENLKLKELPAGSNTMVNELDVNQNLGVEPVSIIENGINSNINSSNTGININNEIENDGTIIIQNNTKENIDEIKPLPEAGSNALENTENLNTENAFIFKTGVDSGPIIINSETASDGVIVQSNTQEEILKLEAIQEEGLNTLDNIHETSPNLDITSDFITNTENDYDSNVNVDNDRMSNFNEIENNGTGVTQNSNQGDIIKLKQQPDIKSNVISNASETIQDFDTEPAFIFKTGIDSGPVVINEEVNNINETVLDGTAVIQNGIQEGVDTIEDLQESGSNTLTNKLEETQNLGIKADFIEGNGTDSNTTLVNVGNSFNEIKNDGAIDVQNNIQEQISNLEQLQEAGSNTLQDLQDLGAENAFIFKTGIDSGPIIVNNEVNNLYEGASDGTIIVQNDVQEENHKLKELPAGSNAMVNELDLNQNLGAEPISTVENGINSDISSSNTGININNEIENDGALVIQNNTKENIDEIKPLPEAGSNALENTENLNTENAFIFKTGVDSGPILVNSEVNSFNEIQNNGETIVENDTQEEVDKLAEFQGGSNIMDDIFEVSSNLNVETDFIIENGIDSSENTVNLGMSNLNEIENDRAVVIQNNTQEEIGKLKQLEEVRSNATNNDLEETQNLSIEAPFIFKPGIDSGPKIVNNGISNSNEIISGGVIVEENIIQEGVVKLEKLQGGGDNFMSSVNSGENLANNGINNFNKMGSEGTIVSLNNIQTGITKLEKLQGGTNTLGNELNTTQITGMEIASITENINDFDVSANIENHKINNVNEMISNGAITVQNDTQEDRTKLEQLEEGSLNIINNLLETTEKLDTQTPFVNDNINSNASFQSNGISNLYDVASDAGIILKNNMQDGMVKLDELQGNSDIMNNILELTHGLEAFSTLEGIGNIDSNENLENNEIKSLNEITGDIRSMENNLQTQLTNIESLPTNLIEVETSQDFEEIKGNSNWFSSTTSINYQFSNLYAHLLNIGSMFWSSLSNISTLGSATVNIDLQVSPTNLNMLSPINRETPPYVKGLISELPNFDKGSFLQNSILNFQTNLIDIKKFIEESVFILNDEKLACLQETDNLTPPQMQIIHDLFASMQVQVTSLIANRVTISDIDIAKEYLNGALQVMKQPDIYEEINEALVAIKKYLLLAAQYLPNTAIGNTLAYAANVDNALIPLVIELTKSILDNIQISFYTTTDTLPNTVLNDSFG